MSRDGINHTCSAIVVTCIDFRLQKYLKSWTDTKLKNEEYDYVGFAGGVKDTDTVLKQIDISVRLHHINNVFLINHEDCGAYGESGTKEKHTEDLRKAQTEILKNHPQLKVDLYYLHINGTFKQIR